MSKQSEKVELEEESDNFVVVDPDNYQKTKKLQSIREAKDHFKEVRRNENEIKVELKGQWRNYREAYRDMRAKAVSDYASEMVPLIEAGLESNTLSEDNLIASLGPKKHDIDVRWVAKNNGKINVDGEMEPLPGLNCSEVYRQLERIERELGLGLDLEEDKGPAQI